MRNKFVKAMAIMLALAAVCPFYACNGNQTDDTPQESTEPVDLERTQLYVVNDNSCYGTEWLTDAKARFEALHANDVCWEAGKKGVQVVIENASAGVGDAKSVSADEGEVFFVQETDYSALRKSGAIAEITGLVTQSIEADGRTIADKMDSRQRSRYGEGEGSEIAYYAIPTHRAFFGLVYNAELFDKEGYYLLDAPKDAQKTADYFVQASTDVRSAGPDGEKGNEDDGLPTTYEEFFLLCDYIAGKGQIPVMWTGKDYAEYLTRLAGALTADYEGYAQTMLTYTMDGTAENLGKIVNGAFTLDEQPTPITTANAYELARQAGNYYALQFIRKLTLTDDYTSDRAFDDRYGRYTAQADFLQAGQDGTTPVAMLADGVWWESQATFAFNAMTEQDEAYSKQNRRFGWMPLPKATEAKTAQGDTLIDTLNAFAFMKSDVAEWKQPLAEEFLQFVFTDESLSRYTRLTGAPTALSYTLTDEDRAALSPYGKSVMRVTAEAEVVYPYSTAQAYRQNESRFYATERWRAKFSLGSAQQYPAEAFRNANISAADYFNGMYRYRESSWREWE